MRSFSYELMLALFASTNAAMGSVLLEYESSPRPSWGSRYSSREQDFLGVTFFLLLSSTLAVSPARMHGEPITTGDQSTLRESIQSIDQWLFLADIQGRNGRGWLLSLILIACTVHAPIQGAKGGRFAVIHAMMDRLQRLQVCKNSR